MLLFFLFTFFVAVLKALPDGFYVVECSSYHWNDMELYKKSDPNEEGLGEFVKRIPRLRPDNVAARAGEILTGLDAVTKEPLGSYVVPPYHAARAFRTPIIDCGTCVSAFNDTVGQCSLAPDRMDEYVRRRQQETTSPDNVRNRHRQNVIRIKMNTYMPKTIQHYTPLGFKLLQLPEDAWNEVLSFYKNNRWHRSKEDWQPENGYVNHWQVWPEMIHMPWAVKEVLINAVRPILQDWTGVPVLDFTSLYGIRLYYNGSSLQNHVDVVATHAVSAIMQIDQDVDEPWPLEVIDHNGQDHQVILKPRDLLLYESATLIHGRPYPLKGKYMANAFLHFKPAKEWGWDMDGNGDLIKKPQ